MGLVDESDALIKSELKYFFQAPLEFAVIDPQELAEYLSRRHIHTGAKPAASLIINAHMDFEHGYVRDGYSCRSDLCDHTVKLGSPYGVSNDFHFLSVPEYSLW